MARDPAFLFYDGDAARDVSHMNRLERGAYFDIIQSQRKFGRLSLDLIKKILGEDFDKTWESLKIILTYVEHTDVFFVQWLEESSIKRKKYCDSRAINRLKSTTKDKKHMSNICKTYVEHMENENENKDILLSSLNSSLKEEEKECEKRKEIAGTWLEPSQEGFKQYITINEPLYDAVYNDWEWIRIQKRYYPGVSIRKTLEKSWFQFWGTEAGWENKRKKSKGKLTYTINWKATLEKTFDINKVFFAKNQIDDEAEFLAQLDRKKRYEQPPK